MPEESTAPDTAPAVRGEGMKEDVYNQYMADEAKIPKLDGKVLAITGTTTGLGFALAKTAITKGARLVMLLNRESERSTKAQADLAKFKVDGSDTEIVTVACDLMSLEHMKETAKKVNELANKQGGLDVLCCNAGIMMMSDKRTVDKFEIQMQTNQISHALLMKLVWGSLEKAASKRGEARVVFQSSSARDSPGTMLESRFFETCEPMTLGGDGAWFITQALGKRHGPISRYHQSKLANSAFGMALHNKLKEKDSKIKALVCEPGYSVTPLQTTSQHLPGFLMWMPVPKQSPADGSLNAAMCCFSPEAESGDMYVPEKGLVGPPKKVIAGGVAVKNGSEKLTCSKENQTIAWEGCEKALGIAFL